MTTPPPDWETAGADWPNRDASSFLRAANVDWHLQRAGPRGRTLLLLHGSGAATHSWRDLLPMLARDFDVIAPDLPRHGFTRAPAMWQPSLPAMAAAVGGLVSALGARPELVVGHSAGCAVALRMVLDHRIAPAAVIGINAALMPFRGGAGTFFSPLAKLLALNPFTPRLFAWIAGRGDTARRLIEGTGSRIDARGLDLYARMLRRPGHVEGALAMMAHWDLEPLLADMSRLTAPLHMLVGDADRAIAPDGARRLAERFPFVRVRAFEAVGHVMHEERPAEIATAIREIAGLPA